MRTNAALGRWLSSFLGVGLIEVWLHFRTPIEKARSMAGCWQKISQGAHQKYAVKNQAGTRKIRTISMASVRGANQN
jgi:hypothetical protein